MSAGARPLRILIVDDDVDALTALVEVLEMLGHTAAAARDGVAAVEQAPQFLPELVLCDLSLPGLDGYEVARALRAHPATARTLLVALTGHVGAEVERAIRAAGFDRHLAKPLDLDALGALLSSVQELAAAYTHAPV